MKKTPSWLAVAFVLSTSGMLHATNWYVDPAAAGANNGTSWANAWTSFSKIAWSSVAPGDTIYLSGGTTSQTYTTPLSIGKSGTSGAPITIAAGQDAGHNGMVIFDGSGGTSPMLNMGGVSYVTVNGNYNGTRHLVFQNNSTTASNGELVYAYGNASTQGVGNKLLWLEVNNASNGISMLYQISGEIGNAYVHNITCDHAIGLAGSASRAPAYDAGVNVHNSTIVVNNAVQSNGAGWGPDAIQTSYGVTIHDNTIQGVSGPTCASPNHQDGVQQGGTYQKIYNNVFSGLVNSSIDSDWSMEPCGLMHVWNNVFTQSALTSNYAGLWMGPQSGCSNLTDVLIANNTFTDYVSLPAILFGGSTAAYTNVLVQNNIFYGDVHPIQFDANNYTCGQGVVISNNNINAGVRGNTAVTCDGTNYAQAQGQAAAPVFVSYTQSGGLKNDLHLQSSSTPDIGTGTNLSNYFSSDKDGVTRPAIGQWDLGAYELNASKGTTNPPPPAPSGLQALVN